MDRHRGCIHMGDTRLGFKDEGGGTCIHRGGVECLALLLQLASQHPTLLIVV